MKKLKLHSLFISASVVGFGVVFLLVFLGFRGPNHLELIAHQPERHESGITITGTIKNGRWGRNQPLVAVVFTILDSDDKEIGIAYGSALAVSANTLRTVKAYFSGKDVRHYQFREFLTGFESAQFLRAQNSILQARMRRLKSQINNLETQVDELEWRRE